MFARVAASVALLVSIAGCESEAYRAETTLSPDGSVTRTVAQPELAWANGVGTVRRQIDTPHAGDWSRPIDAGKSVPPPAGGEKSDAERRTRSVRNARDLPTPVRITPDLGEEVVSDAPPAELSAAATVTDHDLLTVLDWREELSAGTDPVRMERARRRFVRFASKAAPAVLAAGLDGEVHASRLVAWIETTGDDLTADVQAAWLGLGVSLPELGAADPDGERAAELLAPLLAVARDYGVQKPTPGRTDFDATVSRPLLAFARRILRESVTINGRPPTEGELDRAVMLLFNRDPNDEAAPEPVRDAAAAGLAEAFGSTEAVVRELGRIFADWYGVAAADLFGQKSLEYVHRQPGLLLATSGEVLHPGSPDAAGEPAVVLFRFPVAAAHPFGREMTCRTVLLHTDRQRDLLGEVRVADRPAALRFLDLHRSATWRQEWTAARQSADRPRMRRLLAERPADREGGAVEDVPASDGTDGTGG